MFIASTTVKIQAFLSGAAATTNPTVRVDWVDMTTTATTPDVTLSNLNGVTAVDICGSPAASTSRKVNGVSINNIDTAPVVCTVRYNSSGVFYPVVKVTLAVGDTLNYTDTNGWNVLDSAGNIKYIVAGSSGGAAISGGTSSQSSGTIVFSNSNGVSFGLNNGTMTASAVGGGGGGIGLAAGTRTATTANTVLFDNANGITFGLNAVGGSVMTASHNALTTAMQSNAATISNIRVSAGTTSNLMSAVTFDNAGGITFGLNGSVITAVAPAGAPSPVNFSAGTTSGNLDSVVFSNANGVSFGLNGSTITASAAGGAAPYTYSSLVLPDMNISALGALGNGSFSIRNIDMGGYATATRVSMPYLWQQASTANANTIAIAMTVLCGIYTRNNLTLNTISSGSTQTTYSYASNTAGATQIIGSVVRPISLPMNVNLTPGNYYFGFGISTAYSSIGTATTTAAQTISAMGIPAFSSAVGWASQFTAASATSNGMYMGRGVYTAAVSSVVPSISLSAINQSGSYFHRAGFALILNA